MIKELKTERWVVINNIKSDIMKKARRYGGLSSLSEKIGYEKSYLSSQMKRGREHILKRALENIIIWEENK